MSIRLRTNLGGRTNGECRQVGSVLPTWIAFGLEILCFMAIREIHYLPLWGTGFHVGVFAL